MERKSRVSKYQDLRTQLNRDVIGTTVNPEVFEYHKGTPVVIEPVEPEPKSAPETSGEPLKDLKETVRETQKILADNTTEIEVNLNDTQKFGIDLSDTIKLNLFDINSVLDEDEPAAEKAPEPVKEEIKPEEPLSFNEVYEAKEETPKRFEATYEPLFNTDIFDLDEPEESVIDEPKEAEIETAEPEIEEPVLAKPLAEEPLAKEPEVVEPEIVEPELLEPEIFEPEVKEPEIEEPEIAEPEVLEPQTEEPKIEEPVIEEPEIEEPEPEIPELVPVEEVLKEAEEELREPETPEAVLPEEVLPGEEPEETPAEEYKEETTEPETAADNELAKEEPAEEPVMNEELFAEPEEEPAEEPEKLEFVDKEPEYTEPDFDPDALEEENDDLGFEGIGDNFLNQTIDEAKRYSMSKGERSAIDTTSAIIAELTQEPMPEIEPTPEYTGPAVVPDVEDLTRRIEPIKEDAEEMEFNDDLDELLNGEPEEIKPAPLEVNAPIPEPVVIEPEEEPEEEEEEKTQPAEILLDQEAEEAIRDDDLDNSFFSEEETEEIPAAKPEDLRGIKVAPIAEKEEIDDTVMHSDPGDTIVVAKIRDQEELINDLTAKLDREQVLRADLMERTRQMKIDLDEQTEDIRRLYKEHGRTSKFLNLVLGMLIFLLVLLIGAIAWFMLSDRGLLGVNPDVMNTVQRTLYDLTAHYLL